MKMDNYVVFNCFRPSTLKAMLEDLVAEAQAELTPEVADAIELVRAALEQMGVDI